MHLPGARDIDARHHDREVDGDRLFFKAREGDLPCFIVMSAENPYAPPESFDSSLAAGGSNGFVVDGEFLILREGAKLPDLCVGTGATQGELLRFERSIHWIPQRVHLFFFPLILLAWRVNSPVLTIVILIGWCCLLSRFQRRVTVGFAIEQFFFRKQVIMLAGLVVAGLAVMVPIILLPIAFELRVMIVYVLLVDGVRFATFLGKGIRIKDIKDGVARLMNVNPVALAKLGQWNEDDTNGERQSVR